MITDPKYAKKVFEIIKKNVDKVELDYSPFNATPMIRLRTDDIYVGTTSGYILIFNDVIVDCDDSFVKEIVKYVEDYQEEKRRKDNEIRELQAISILESYEV